MMASVDRRFLLASLSALLISAAVHVPSSSVAAVQDEDVLPAADPQLINVDAALEFRRAFALESDPLVVLELLDAWRNDEIPGANTELGVVLTSAEKAEIDERERVIQSDGPIVKEWAKSHPSIYGGVYFDHDSGHLAVLLTQDIIAAEEELVALTRYPDRLSFQPAEFTRQQIDLARADLRMRAPELAKQGIEIASISASNQSNHVTVEVRGDPASAAPVLAGRQPPGLIETVRGDGAELLGTGTNDSPPMRGGQRFAPSGCTTGFVAYDNLGYDLEFYVVTAGHCELETSNLAQYQPNANGNFFGSPRRNSYWDTTIADAMAIGPVSPDEISNDVAILEGGQTYRNIYSWEGLGGDTEGQTDCMSAYANAATIYECGTLLNDSLDANLGGRIFPYMREVSYDCFLGDSGSPHFSGTTAHGITSGRRTSNGNCFYSHTYDVIRALGLDGLRTSDGPGPSTRDYSGDGRADMLGINDIDGRLRVFLGNGTGGFSGTVTLGSGWAPYNAIAGGGDYSGGGKADLLAINDTNGNLYLYPGTGSSGFGAPSLIGGGWATSNAIAGGADHTRDGEPDLFAINDSDGRLRLYPGTGVGGLGTSLDIYGPGWAPYNNIAAGADYTGDGNPDLLGINSTDGRLRIFPGTGEAGLESPITFGPGWNVFTIAGGADYTSDRNADLLAINNASGVLYLYPGNGAGSFLAALTVGPGWSPYNTIA